MTTTFAGRVLRSIAFLVRLDTALLVALTVVLLVRVTLR